MDQPLDEVLKTSRKAKAMTLRTVEAKTGLSNAYLSQLENKKITSPSPNVLRKLADLYEISYSNLLELAGYPVENQQESSPLQRTSNKLDNISPEEEKELVAYLRFLRLKKKGAV